MKIARAKRAKILFFIVKYANVWGPFCRRRRGCLSSLMQPRQCRMTCKGLLTYLVVEVIVFILLKWVGSLTSWFCILEILISIYRKYLNYFERLCSHGMAMET